MKILQVEQNSDDWLELRKGRVTGSKLKDLVSKRGNSRKIGFYQLIADKLALTDELDEDARERGHRLEHEALEQFEAHTGYTVDKDIGLCVSDENEAIAISPDGLIEADGVYVMGTEVKCLGDARHLQVIIENQVPDEYWLQALQYFIVINTLETVHMIFYNPRIIAKPLHTISVERAEVEDEITMYKAMEEKTLQEVDEWVAKLAF